MKAVGVFIIAAVVGIAIALLLGGAFQPQDNDAEIVASAAEIVKTMQESDSQWLERLFVMSDRSNQHYLTVALPYTAMAVAGALLGLGLGVALVVVALLSRRR